MFWTEDQFKALKPGDKIKRFYQPDNQNNRLFHVRGWVDGLVIVRWWSVHKQYWFYETCPRYYFSEFDKQIKSKDARP